MTQFFLCLFLYANKDNSQLYGNGKNSLNYMGLFLRGNDLNHKDTKAQRKPLLACQAKPGQTPQKLCVFVPLWFQLTEAADMQPCFCSPESGEFNLYL